MEITYRYKLEKGSKKFQCPRCERKTFKRYIDSESGEYLSPEFGRCDREQNCSYHLIPSSEGKREFIPIESFSRKGPERVFFDLETYLLTLDPERYESNTFIQNLFYNVPYPFEVEEVTKVIEMYWLGTIINGYRSGAVTFPFIDIDRNIRAVQVKQFDEENHTKGTDFLHSIMIKHLEKKGEKIPSWLREYSDQDKKISCLFGEHLLSDYPYNPVAIVEAPKTAVYGSLCFGPPETSEDLIWLAVYNKSSFSLDKLKVLKGRRVIVFPDLSSDGGTYAEWKRKAESFARDLPGTSFIFSDLLEEKASEEDKKRGLDLADFLIQQDWSQFRSELIYPCFDRAPFIKSDGSDGSDEPKTKVFFIEPESKIPENWDLEINELKAFFHSQSIKEVRLDKGTSISNPEVFIQSHLDIISANNGNQRFKPYLNRLLKFKSVLTEK